MLLRTPFQHRATWRKHPKTGLNFTLQFGVFDIEALAGWLAWHRLKLRLAFHEPNARFYP
jgi:hypothetical protein